MRKDPNTQIPKCPNSTTETDLLLGHWALGPWTLSSLGFHALGGAWLFALIAPLVLFYFLKLKRPRLQVPSLVLWKQVVQDRRVNSPFQRFKRNLLLLLQLLLLILLVLAALQPFLQRRPSRALRIPVLIDCSASMAALGPASEAQEQAGQLSVSRLDAAKKQVLKMVDDLLGGQEMCIVSFSRTARRRTDFTSNKRILRKTLEEIQVEDVPSDFEEALRMAQALGRTASFDEVILLSDGNLPERAHFQLPFRLDYGRLPPAGPNIGITSLNARRRPGRDWDVFVLVEGSADAEAAATVQVDRDGQPLGSQRVFVSKGGEERLLFRVSGETASSLEVKLVPEQPDSLACDNAAYLYLPALRSLQVYVSPSLRAYRHAALAIESVDVYTEPPTSSCDLVITDRAEDLDLPASTRFCVGIVPGDLSGIIEIKDQPTAVVDWNRACPLLEYVELGDLAVMNQPLCREGITDSDLENNGYEVLAHGDKGPLLVKKQEPGRLSFFLLFHSDRSTLPYRVGFPVLVSNLVQTAMYEAGLAEARGLQTGVLGGIVLRPNCSYAIQPPEGASVEQTTDDAGVLSGVPAPRVGYYRISEGGELWARLGAALLSSSETSLQGVDKIMFDEDLSVTTSGKQLKTDLPLWPILAMLAFCVMLGEWWYFQRGAGGSAQ